MMLFPRIPSCKLASVAFLFLLLSPLAASCSRSSSRNPWRDIWDCRDRGYRNTTSAAQRSNGDVVAESGGLCAFFFFYLFSTAILKGMAGGFPKVETWFEVLEGQCSLTSWTKPRCDSVSSPCLSGRCGGKCEWPLAVLTTPCTPPIVLAAVVIESREVSCRIRNTSMPGVSSRTSQVSLHRLRISFHLWRFSDSGNLDLPYFVLLHKSSTPCSEKKKGIRRALALSIWQGPSRATCASGAGPVQLSLEGS